MFRWCLLRLGRSAELRCALRATSRFQWDGRHAERAFLGCRRRGRCRRFLVESVYLPHQKKNGESNEQEIDDVVDEDAVVESRRPGGFRFGDRRVMRT